MAIFRTLRWDWRNGKQKWGMPQVISLERLGEYLREHLEEHFRKCVVVILHVIARGLIRETFWRILRECLGKYFGKCSGEFLRERLAELLGRYLGERLGVCLGERLWERLEEYSGLLIVTVTNGFHIKPPWCIRTSCICL